ncbi:MAG TPA: dethiobiotin synthase [Solirubrobacterales bacterium]
MPGVFVTGTGTEVGKTVVAAVIAHTLASEGKHVAVFKPAVTGLDDHPDPGADGPQMCRYVTFTARRPDHVVLREAAGSGQTDDEIAPYRYEPPMSPHLAAALTDEEIDPGRLREGARAAADGAEAFVCEGVGGLLVPLAPGYLVRDFAADLALPLVVVASPGLGTINHTLLTVEAARAAGLAVELIVLNPWPDSPGQIEESNRETIAALTAVRVKTLPRIDLDDPASWPQLALS